MRHKYSILPLLSIALTACASSQNVGYSAPTYLGPAYLDPTPTYMIADHQPRSRHAVEHVNGGAGIEFELTSHSTSQAASIRAGKQLDEHAMLSLETYASELETVASAVERFNPHSIASDREYMGVVVRQLGAYRYLVARGKPGEDTVTVHLPIPKGAEVVAYWHTHGSAGPHRHLFSAADTRLVKLSGKPFYMADASGDIRIYRPGDPTLSVSAKRRMGLRFEGRVAAGELVCSPLSRPNVQPCERAQSG